MDQKAIQVNYLKLVIGNKLILAINLFEMQVITKKICKEVV